MKNFILISLFLFGLTIVLPTVQSVNAQAWSIKIDADQDKDSMYIMLSDTVESKYRWGKFKSYNTMDDFARRTLDGGQNYKIELVQATTAAPTVNEIFWNTLAVGAPVWTRDSIGTYKATKTDMFAGYDVHANVTIGLATGACMVRAYKQSDSTLIVRFLRPSGITATGVDLAGKACIDLLLVPTD